MQYATTPIFNKDTLDDNRQPSITTEFYLINDSSVNLKKNFEFLHSLFAGTQWIQLKFGYKRSPNVYNVYCHSRFNYIWATLDMTVNSCGKVYRNKEISEKIYEEGIKNVNAATLWPTAWKVSITIHSLIPNSFNTYLEFLLNGFNYKTVITYTTFAETNNSAMTLFDNSGKMINDLVSKSL